MIADRIRLTLVMLWIVTMVALIAGLDMRAAFIADIVTSVAAVGLFLVAFGRADTKENS